MDRYKLLVICSGLCIGAAFISIFISQALVIWWLGILMVINIIATLAERDS